MNEYRFVIDESYMDKFFSPIKNKVQIIELLMNSVKYMILNQPVKKNRISGEMVLITGQISRLFFFKDKKYFSIAFPFLVSYEEAYFFSFKNKMNIDGRLTSEVISLINDNNFHSNCSLEFVSPITDYQELNNEYYWDFVRELLFMEDGYLRYDYDMINFDKHGQSDFHPLNHYDLFYSGNATFKIGLKTEIMPNDFIDQLNPQTVCKFID